MKNTKVKVKKSDKFQHRRMVLDIDNKAYRKLQNGFEVEIKTEDYSKNSSAFEIIKTKKIGDKKDA